MSVPLKSVGEAGERSSSKSSMRQTPLSTEYSESTNDNVFELTSSISSLGSVLASYHEIQPSYAEENHDIFGFTGCQSKLRFSLGELSFGIANDSSLLGNKLNPLTRRENARRAVLEYGNDEETAVEIKEVIERNVITGVDNVFQKELADILKLLASRSDKPSSPEDQDNAMSRRVQNALTTTAAFTAVAYKDKMQVGVMRKPLRVIAKSLSDRIKELGIDQKEWDHFEQTISRAILPNE
jgi:hypothetical protein